MDLTDSYTSSFRLMRVNTQTWEDEEEIATVHTARVDRNCTDDYSLLETSQITLNTEIGFEFDPGWYRLEMLATDTSGEHLRLPIATHRIQATSGILNRGFDEKTLTGQSVLQPAAKKKMAVGTHVPVGVNAVDYVIDLLAKASPAVPVTAVGNGFIVDEHYVFDPQTSYLRAAWDVLGMGDWCMQIDGSGLVTIMAKPDEPSLVLDRSTRRIVLPGINYDFDLSNIPNHYVAVDSAGNTYEAFNTYEWSDTSVQSMDGLINDYIDTAPTPINGEGLDGYVRRRLEEESIALRKFSYTREYVPGVDPYDLVSAYLVSDGMVGDLRVLSQSLTCSHGITVTETAAEEIMEYER